MYNLHTFEECRRDTTPLSYPFICSYIFRYFPPTSIKMPVLTVKVYFFIFITICVGYSLVSKFQSFFCSRCQPPSQSL